MSIRGFPDWQRAASDIWSVETNSSPTIVSSSVIQWTVPSNERWKPIFARLDASVSGGATDAWIDVQIRDDLAQVLAEMRSLTQTTPGGSTSWRMFRNAGTTWRGAQVNFDHLPLFDFGLEPGWVLRVSFFTSGGSISYSASTLTHERAGLT